VLYVFPERESRRSKHRALQPLLLLPLEMLMKIGYELPHIHSDVCRILSNTLVYMKPLESNVLTVTPGWLTFYTTASTISIIPYACLQP
jgi:hypothetical protein